MTVSEASPREGITSGLKNNLLPTKVLPAVSKWIAIQLIMASSTPAQEEVLMEQFEGSVPADWRYVNYSGDSANDLVVPTLVAGSDGKGGDAGRALYLGSLSALTRGPNGTETAGGWMQLPLAIDPTVSFSLTADVKVLNEGPWDDFCIFFGDLDESRLFSILSVEVGFHNDVFYLNPSRPDEIPGTAHAGGYATVESYGIGIKDGEWMKVGLTWDASRKQIFYYVTSLHEAGSVADSFWVILDGTHVHPENPSVIVNQAPQKFQLGIGTFNNNVTMDNVKVVLEPLMQLRKLRFKSIRPLTTSNNEVVLDVDLKGPPLFVPESSGIVGSDREWQRVHDYQIKPLPGPDRDFEIHIPWTNSDPAQFFRLLR